MRSLPLFLLAVQVAFGCTDFVLQTTDGTFVNGRSLEFGTELEAKIQVFPRKMDYATKGPDGERGVEWVSQYGYLGITVFDLQFSMDGMNEKGLSFGFLWLPGTQYQSISPSDAEKPLDFAYFADWVLGNFATVPEVREALKGVRVWGHPMPPFPGTPPVHAAIHDAMGHHLVVEFVEGEMKVYENPNTVLTNYPTFDWMLTNLQNYIQLDAYNAPPAKWKRMTVNGTGQGTGLIGLPGDPTPPSRFVKMTTLLRFAAPAQSAADGINLAEHLLNTVDIPLGTIRERAKNKESADYTQWIAIKDLTSRIFYFRSYKDLCLKSIDMRRLNFTPGTRSVALPLDLSKGYLDVTDKLRTASSSAKVR